MTLSTHVLDTSLGKPAASVPVRVEVRDEATAVWRALIDGLTDQDGRMKVLTSDFVWRAGVYRIRFDTEAYFTRVGTLGFYPEVTVVFEIRNPTQHYHVPLLLSPYGYSTYRGS